MMKKDKRENKRSEIVTEIVDSVEKSKINVGLNDLQLAHLRGEIDVYAPIEAYAEEWEHVVDEHGNFVSAHPIPGTRRRADLPSLAEQWRNAAHRRSNRNEQSSSNRRSSRSGNR